MSVVKEIDPELAWKLIEGYEDELEPESKALDAFYRQVRCPRCKEPMHKEYDTRHVFSDPDTMNPRALLRCECGLLLEPHTNVILDSGSPAKMPIEVIPHIGTKD